jgi:SAM-dependent methyltransferase
MAKKIKFESFVFRFLIAARQLQFAPKDKQSKPWSDFVSSIKFKYENSDVGIHWSTPDSNKISVPLSHAKFYLRGDSISNVAKQLEAGLLNTEDRIKLKNDDFFKTTVMRVAESAGYEKTDQSSVLYDKRIQKERDFHDAWAETEDVEKIDVIAANVVCTAPEMRFIANRLGDIKGKHLLDVGCGLGEASVYFAMLGADVTSSDLSQGMLDATTRLASRNGVNVKQHLASAEDMRLPVDVKFDIIYCGNLLHHVDIEDTITRVKPHLAKGGIFVSWDPLAYNPAINVYRSIATGVRTPDEHPLKWSDVKLFKKHFSEVETKYFWFTTLIIFVIMALAQRRNPNKERFWKVVVQEGDKWAWLYRPLERLDSVLLAVFPPLRLLCWNIVIVSKV